MKNFSIKPVPGQPTQFKKEARLLDIEPLLEWLFRNDSRGLAKNMDEMMYLLVELNAQADNLDKDLLYESYVNLRDLRDAFSVLEIKPDAL